ncbi:hypothetical protein C6T53_29915, partial [Burkholderia multivorans]
MAAWERLAGLRAALRGTVAIGVRISPHLKRSLSELSCVRHKLMAKEPRYATQTQGRSAGRT